MKPLPATEKKAEQKKAGQEKQPLFLSIPAFDVLNNIFLCPHLTEEEQLLLGRAFYHAYHAHMEGRTQPLDERLGNMLGKLSK